MTRAARKIPLAPNSIKHHILWEISIRTISTSDLLFKARKLTAVSPQYVRSILVQLLEDKLIRAVPGAPVTRTPNSTEALNTATWASTETGRSTVNDVGRPHFTKRQDSRKSAMEKLRKTGETCMDIKLLPALSPTYLSYEDMALRPGSLDYRKIPSAHH